MFYAIKKSKPPVKDCHFGILPVNYSDSEESQNSTSIIIEYTFNQFYNSVIHQRMQGFLFLQWLQPKIDFDFIFSSTQKDLGWFLHKMQNAEF